MLLELVEIAACAAVGPADELPFVIKDKTSPSSRSILFCISSGVAFGPVEL